MSEEMRLMLNLFRNFDGIIDKSITEGASRENSHKLNDLLVKVNQTKNIPELYALIDEIGDVIFDLEDERIAKANIDKKILTGELDSNERIILYKKLNKERENKYDELRNKILEKINDIERTIILNINKLYAELNVSKKTYSWGNSPMDEELGRAFGDERGKIFLKEYEGLFIGDNGEDNYCDGLGIELIIVKKEYRNSGVAKKLLVTLINAADKFDVKLYITIAPQENNIDLEKLKKLYEGFGFKFDGIYGYRLPSTSTE